MQLYTDKPYFKTDLNAKHGFIIIIDLEHGWDFEPVIETNLNKCILKKRNCRLKIGLKNKQYQNKRYTNEVNNANLFQRSTLMLLICRVELGFSISTKNNFFSMAGGEDEQKLKLLKDFFVKN